MQVSRNVARKRRHIRLRKKISGTEQKPRLNVFKSNKAIYVQVINDVEGKTLVSASSVELKLTNNNIDKIVRAHV